MKKIYYPLFEYLINIKIRRRQFAPEDPLKNIATRNRTIVKHYEPMRKQ